MSVLTNREKMEKERALFNSNHDIGDFCNRDELISPENLIKLAGPRSRLSDSSGLPNIHSLTKSTKNMNINTQPNSSTITGNAQATVTSSTSRSSSTPTKVSTRIKIPLTVDNEVVHYLDAELKIGIKIKLDTESVVEARKTVKKEERLDKLRKSVKLDVSGCEITFIS